MFLVSRSNTVKKPSRGVLEEDYEKLGSSQSWRTCLMGQVWSR